MNALGEFLKKNGISASDFGAQIGASHTSVYDWMNGKKMPGRKFLPKIHRATKGEVTANDFYLPSLKTITRAG